MSLTLLVLLMVSLKELTILDADLLIAHNTFAIPVLMDTVEIIDWTTQEIKEIDVRTRKQLTTTGNFYSNGDVDKLYLPKSQRGWGLKMVARMFESRVIAVGQYLTINSNRSNIIKFVYEQEQQNIIHCSIIFNATM